MKKILFIITVFFFSLLSCFDGLNEAYNKKSGLKMVRVPAGTFDYDETTIATCQIYISAFYISPYEITRKQFKEIMGADPSNVSLSPTTDCPVHRVNWYQTLVFCNRLSIREDLEPVYTINGSTDPDDWGSVPTAANDPIWDAAICDMNADGYRLPTESEWRWAAMGATKDSRSGDIIGGVNQSGYIKGYAGSTESLEATVNIGNYAWCDLGLGAPSHPVGTKLPNELGLYDMTGNVWEWCWDRNDGTNPFPGTGSLVNYKGINIGNFRIFVGGNAQDTGLSLTIRNREEGRNPYDNAALDLVGFRVVRSAGSGY